MDCTPPEHRNSAGFTLVEMMVALLIFSLLSVAGVALLRSAVNSNEVTGENLSEMASMQRLVSLMEADLSQAVPRSYRDETGEKMPAFNTKIGNIGDSFFTFTKGGQSNINNRPRSNLARISYRLSEGRLERLQTEMTDGGAASEPAVLLENISDINVRFRSKSGLWSNDWRTERMSDMPRAVEIIFTQEGRNYRHLFLVGTGYL